MATSNWHGTLARWLPGGILCLLLSLSPASEHQKTALSPKFVAIAEKGLMEARRALATTPEDVERIWQLGRALYFRAEFTIGKERGELAEEGIAVCESGLARAPDSAECHYYLAMNQGQLAREKLWGALGLVRAMRDHLRLAALAKPKLDHAGPDRCLGLLFRDAPGWPVSVGDGKAAVVHLDRAYSLASDYPENLLVLLESRLKRGDRKAAKILMSQGGAVLEKAKLILEGPHWEPYHHDWAARWKDIRARLGD